MMTFDNTLSTKVDTTSHMLLYANRSHTRLPRISDTPRTVKCNDQWLAGAGATNGSISASGSRPAKAGYYEPFSFVCRFRLIPDRLESVTTNGAAALGLSFDSRRDWRYILLDRNRFLQTRFDEEITP